MPEKRVRDASTQCELLDLEALLRQKLAQVSVLSCNLFTTLELVWYGPVKNHLAVWSKKSCKWSQINFRQKNILK